MWTIVVNVLTASTRQRDYVASAERLALLAEYPFHQFFDDVVALEIFGRKDALISSICDVVPMFSSPVALPEELAFE